MIASSQLARFDALLRKLRISSLVLFHVRHFARSLRSFWLLGRCSIPAVSLALCYLRRPTSLTMPSPVSEADEFGLMDSLFDDLDAELLQSIDKPASVTSVKKPTVSARLTAVPHPAPSKRNPLQPVSSNGRSQLSQDRSLDLKGKGRAIDVPAVSTSKPKTQPFRPTAHAPPVAKTSPYFQKAGSSFKPSTSTPNAALKARELPVSKADADLLHDLNWSEEEEEFKTKPATAKQTLIKQSTSARINPLASKASKPTASAAEQSSRAKAEQLANLRKQPGYVGPFTTGSCVYLIRICIAGSGFTALHKVHRPVSDREGHQSIPTREGMAIRLIQIAGAHCFRPPRVPLSR